MTGGAATGLSWSPPLQPGATSVTYDLLRSTSPSNFTSGTVCLATSTAATTASDGTIPAHAFFYLVRSRNACGSNLGLTSAGVARTGRTCP